MKNESDQVKASKIIKSKIEESGGSVKVRSLRGKVYDIESRGSSFYCEDLPKEVVFNYEIFDIIVDFLVSQGGSAKKGTGRNAKLGEPGCDSSTVAGTVGEKYFRKQQGESVYDPIFILASVLDWAGIVKNELGRITLTPEYKKKLIS